jgi:hypothetical protein
MCVGLPIVGALLSIGQAAVGFMGAQQAANEQNAYHERNRVAAVAAAGDKYASLNNQTLQHREAASDELLQKRIDALKARATAKVASGEAGVTGLSVNALLADFVAQQSRQEQAVQTNYEIRKMANYDEAVATYHHTIGRINSVRTAASPSILPFILQGIGGAVNAHKPAGVTALG